MTELRPDFYGEFSCKASACSHTCCRGWEIDIDGDTARYYLSLDGSLGYELREALLFNGETYSFKLTGDGRCPFLRGDGLCRLILELGEDALSDICALHPRFFLNFSGFELCGLGLACEKAAELLLSGRGRLGFLTESGRSLSLDDIFDQKISAEPTLTEEEREKVIAKYALCEPIDDRWESELRELSKRPLPKSYDREAFERMTDYILFRRLEDLEEYGPQKLLLFAREAGELVLFLSEKAGLCEALRRWSEETEYSTENVRILMNA